MVIDFITTPIWKALNAEIDRATEEENNINEHIEELEEVSSRAFNELHTDKQDALVSGTNIKTINNQSILGSGNIEIQGGGGGAYSAGTNIDITDNVISVIGITVPTKTSELTNDSGFITSASLPTKTSDLTNDSGFITSASLPTKTSDLTNDSGFITSSDTRNFVNSGQVQTQINNSISGYATTAFTEATYLKEHQSLSAYSTTQQMNVAISNAVADKVASNDVDNIVKISQADYDALSAYTSTTLYLIPE